MSVYSFRRQVWDWSEYESLKEIIGSSSKTHEKLTVEIHAQVNSVMIGMLVAGSAESKKQNVEMEVVVFNKNSEKSLDMFGVKSVMKTRPATGTERYTHCSTPCGVSCEQPCHECRLSR